MSKPDPYQTKRCKIVGKAVFHNPSHWPKAKMFADMETLRSDEYSLFEITKKRMFQKKAAQTDNGETLYDLLEQFD